MFSGCETGSVSPIEYSDKKSRCLDDFGQLRVSWGATRGADGPADGGGQRLMGVAVRDSVWSSAVFLKRISRGVRTYRMIYGSLLCN